MPQTSSVSQSYLVEGPEEKRVKITKQLAKSNGIFFKKNSPDVYFIAATNSHLSISQVRDLKRHIFQKPLSEKYKLVIIKDAQQLTFEAQNALLKILEEPPSHAIIILEVDNRQNLLPTIISRCIVKKSPPLKTIQISQSHLITQREITKSLEEIADIKDASQWLDEQMLKIHQILIKEVNKKTEASNIEKFTKAIEKCRQAKEMIQSNVNPKFVLANLILSLNFEI